MIKNIFRIFFFLIAASLTLAFLYVFELPPFQISTETLPTNELSGEEAALAAEEANLPEELIQPKIERDKSYEEMIDRAKQLEQNGFPSLAVAQYQEAFKKDSSKTSPLFEIGKIYLRTKNYGNAETMFKDLAEKYPTSVDAKTYLGKAYLGQRKIEEAKSVFNGIISEKQSVKYYQGIIAAYLGEHDKAKELLNEAITLGGSEEYTKKTQNFLSAYNEYQFNTESPTVHLKVLLARSYNQCGEYELAIPLLFEVTKEKLDYRDAWILLGYAYLQTDKFPDAIEALERAKILDNQKPETLFYLGLAYYNVNKFTDAEINLSLAKEYGYEPKILVDQKLAEVYLELQNYPKSAASYEKVLALNSQNVNYFIRPIWIYIEKLDSPQQALILAEKARKEHPQEAMAENLMGWTLIYNNQLDKAEDHLKVAMALNAALDATYLNFGLLYERKNELDKALLFYKKAHTLGEGNGIAASAASHYNKLLASFNNAQTLQANITSP
jgi:tetratricopeptide (TPR) repeat protein